MPDTEQNLTQLINHYGHLAFYDTHGDIALLIYCPDPDEPTKQASAIKWPIQFEEEWKLHDALHDVIETGTLELTDNSSQYLWVELPDGEVFCF